MATVYLGLGTNMGSKPENLETAASLLAERTGDILALSDMYETEPWGFESENNFLNAAVKLQTSLSPEELLDATRMIEEEMGRTLKTDGVYQDRIIDIDILMYDDLVMQTGSLVIPHPLMHERSFVLAPLVEIAPDVIHPVFHRTIAELAGLL